MARNVMDDYISLTRQSIIDYMKVIFEKKFDRKICLEFIKTYMDIRYYDLNENKLHKELKNDIIDALNEKKDKLLEVHKLKKNTIINMNLFFCYILYLDNVIPYKDEEKVIQDIFEIRNNVLKKDNEEFLEEFKKVFISNSEKREKFLKKFESEEFYLKITNYLNKPGVYRINLKYNFKLPVLYSVFAIDKAYNSGLTAEDKLYVEYNLASAVIIKDLIKGNFKKQYIVEFADSILAKSQKSERLFSIIENQAVQDKLTLKIKYKAYQDNKEMIHELIKRGFKFAVILDNTYELTYSEFERLGVFKYVLINKDYKYKRELKKNSESTNNIIEI